MSRKAFWEVVTTLVLGLSLSAALQASIDRGVIQGTVTDPAGALVPGAKVVVKNVDTNVEVTLVTNAAGFYLAPELVPGRYTVRAESPGFVPLDVTNVVVTAGVTSQQDLTLRVGALTQSIVHYPILIPALLPKARGSDLPVRHGPSKGLPVSHELPVRIKHDRISFRASLGLLPVQAPCAVWSGIEMLLCGRARWPISASIRDPQFTAAKRMRGNGIRPPGAA